MTATVKKRITSLIIALSIILSLIPSGMSLKGTGENSPSINDIGATGYVWANSFPLSSDPTAVATDKKAFIYEIKKSEMPERIVITDYYLPNSKNAEAYYKIDAAPGYYWNSQYTEYHWIEAKSVTILYRTTLKDTSGNTVNTAIQLLQYNKTSLFATSTLTGEVTYQWQICYNRAKELFADIQGDNTPQLNITYGKIQSLIDYNNTVLVRCKISNGNDTVYTTVATVSVLPYTKENSGNITDNGNITSESKIGTQSAISPFSLASYGVNTFDTEPDIKKTYNVVINYVFENGVTAYDPYTATLAEGDNFSTTVTFPTVQGYLPYLNDVQQNSMELNYTNISADDTITVVYKPTNVNYTVIHYQQNIDDDHYTIESTETKQGLTASQVPEVAKTFTGFYSLLYERPAIAADGSTVIEIYYDRYYYLINFDMDGGYGTDPVYARYGAQIGTVTNLTKAGYTFEGWSETKGGTEAVTLPENVPAESKTYYAIWKVDDTAKVTVVFWGENADDEQYSYLSTYTKEIYLKPGSEFTYSETGMLTCGKDTHTHTDDCYEFICNTEAHEHNSTCYTCGNAEHKHGIGCYPGASSEIPDGASAPWDAPSNPKNGQVLVETHILVQRKYIYIDGKWYTYSGNVSSGSIVSPNCGMTEHTHTTACIGCGKTEHEHTRANCYKLTCTEPEHTHTSSCYQQGAGLDSTLWKFVKSDTITVAADGSSVVNVYYDRVEYSVQFYNNQSCSTSGWDNKEYTDLKITAKWGENILNKWPTYDNSSSWYVKDKSNTWQNSIQVMPVGGAKFWGPKSGNSKYTATYYVEILDGESYAVKGSDGRYYKVHHTDTSNSSGNVTDEERYGIDGFTINNSISTSNGSSYGGSKFYYTRNSYKLTFNDQYDDVENETVKFEAPLSTYKDYKPEVPSAYEPGSVTFGGWYQNPQCTGEEYKLDEHTMPSHDIILYAKWVPVTHTVTFYLTESDLKNNNVYNPDETTEEDATFEVPHGGYVAQKYVDNHLTIEAMNEAKPNGDYNFVIWYYYENGEKKYFDPTMQIRKDLNLVAEWSSNTLKQYVVQYVLKDDHSVKVADDLTGSGLAGTTKTFDAKGGTDLYAAYQEGYFPTVQSQSLLLDIESNSLVITFEYVPMPAVPYTVKYVEKDTGKSLANDKVVSDNRKAVVTEPFKPISGYMPDAYQKRLVVTADGENILYFYYTKDETHAYYKITHYTQNTDGKTWTEYASSQAVGDIGTRYTASPMTIPGFTYNEIKYVVNGNEVKDIDITAEGAKLTADGLEINLYYVRNEYPYQVRYLEQGTGQVLHTPKNGKGLYGQVISESAVDIDGYDKVDPTSATLNIRIDEGEGAPHLNIITFYYKEQEVTINYVAVGPEGATDFGSVYPTAETVKVKNGTAYGSTPTAGDGYKFAGWFKDKDCTQPVDTSWVTDNKIVPQKNSDGKNVEATYYAKFERDTVDFTITKELATDTPIDQSQVFMFNVKGADDKTSGIDVTVAIKVDGTGKGSVTVKDLPAGKYTVSEITDWSWRYEVVAVEDTEREVSLENDHTETFKNKIKDNKWLDHNTNVNNVFNTNNK